MITANLRFFIFALLACFATANSKVDDSMGNSENEDTIPETSAKEYLSKFGWVKPSVWAEISPYYRHLLLNPKAPNENSVTSQSRSLAASLAALTEGNWRETRFGRVMTTVDEKRYVEALKNFQRENSLQVTGVLDEATSMVMQQPRCGVPDHMTSPTGTINQEATSQMGSIFGELLVNQTLKLEELSQTQHSRSKRELNYFENPFKGVTLVENEVDESIRGDELTKSLENYRRRWAAEEEVKMTKEQARSMMERIYTMRNLKEASKSRQKRSSLFKIVDGKTHGEKVITWRLSKNWPSTNPYMTMNEVWFTLRLAFRMWSEVLPRYFRESPSAEGSDEHVDILLGFAVGQHNECPATFNTAPFVREYAHAWPLPWAQVHFNDNEMFVPFSWSSGHQDAVLKTNKLPISLLKVALHEIGHALGLKHSNNRSSIMYPFYKPFQNKEIVELSDTDRNMVRQIYGPCKSLIDAIFDVVFVQKNDKNEYFLKYNTFIFRKGYFWMYKNQDSRPVYGYPKMISKYWRDLRVEPDNFNSGIDAVVQTRETNLLGTILFFTGEYFSEYDMNQERMKDKDSKGNLYPQKIKSVFKYGPSVVDAAMYNFQEKLLYLFRDGRVWRYRWPSRSFYDYALIKSIFPVVRSHGYWKWADQLVRVSAAYYSLSDNSYYLMYGERYWRVNAVERRKVNESVRTYRRNGTPVKRWINPVDPPRTIASKWHHLCEVGPEEINLSLPDA